jgi:hypothetical protein
VIYEGRRALAVIAASLILFASQARGQQPVHRVGVLMETESPWKMQALLEGLRERGHVRPRAGVVAAPASIPAAFQQKPS